LADDVAAVDDERGAGDGGGFVGGEEEDAARDLDRFAGAAEWGVVDGGGALSSR
jgi:hypothetical protein